MWNKFQSTKWQLTVFIGMNATIGMYTTHLSGGEWIGIMTVLFTGYTVANVLGDKLPNKGLRDERRD